MTTKTKKILVTLTGEQVERFNLCRTFYSMSDGAEHSDSDIAEMFIGLALDSDKMERMREIVESMRH